MGYRHVLELIHANMLTLKITSNTIKKLHDLAQEGPGDAGQIQLVLESFHLIHLKFSRCREFAG